MSTLDPIKEHCFRRDFGSAQQPILQGISPGRATSTVTARTSGLSSQLTWASTPFSKPSTTKYHSYKSLPHEFIVRMVGQTFLHVGADDPRLNSACKIDFRISRTIAAWKKSDSPPNRVISIPTIQVIRRMDSVSYTTFASPLCRAIADMIKLAFFFLLRPGIHRQ